MSGFTSSSPELDLTIQNLANSATIIQAIAHYQQNDRSGGPENPHVKQWRMIGKVAVTLVNNKTIIPPEELHFLRVHLSQLENVWVELEQVLKKKKTFWGKMKRALGKPVPKHVKERLNGFEAGLFELDWQVQIASARALVKLAQSASPGESVVLSPTNAHSPSVPRQPYTHAVTTALSKASTNTAVQLVSPSGNGTSSGLELRMRLPTSRNPFADPSKDYNADWEGDDGDGIPLLNIPNQIPQESSQFA